MKETRIRGTLRRGLRSSPVGLRRAAIGSQSRAAMPPRIRPISAPTPVELRWLRAVVFCAAAGVRMRGDSTFFASAISCVVCVRSVCSVESLNWSRSLSVGEKHLKLSAAFTMSTDR